MSKYNIQKTGREHYILGRKNPSIRLTVQNVQSGEVRALRHNRFYVTSKLSQSLKEDKVPDRVEKDAEKFVKDLKPKKADFVKRYAKDAERVMYATAMNMQEENMLSTEEKKYALLHRSKIVSIKLNTKNCRRT